MRLTEEVKSTFALIIRMLVVDQSLGVETILSISPVESHLPMQTDRPDDDSHNNNGSQSEITTSSSREPCVVENEETDEKSTNDGTGAFECGV